MLSESKSHEVKARATLRVTKSPTVPYISILWIELFSLFLSHHIRNNVIKADFGVDFMAFVLGFFIFPSAGLVVINDLGLSNIFLH